MHSFDPAVFRRFALVLGLLAGFAGLHATLAVASDPGSAQVPQAARPALSHQTGYGPLPCGAEACQVEYCAAPASSDLQGYAVPCESARAG